MNQVTGMDGCKRCPTCMRLPEMTLEPKVLNQEGDDVVLRCVHHGHVAIGDDLTMAVAHWNHYIAWVIHTAARHAMEVSESKFDTSYCTVCGDFTKTDDFPHKLECAVCKAVKFWKPEQPKKHMAAAVFMLLALYSGVAGAWSTSLNPDRYPSFGFDVIKGQLTGLPRAGIGDLQTSGQIVGGKLDFRLPISNAVTLHAMAESDGIDNNLQYTDGYRLEMGMRVYFKDWQ